MIVCITYFQDLGQGKTPPRNTQDLNFPGPYMNLQRGALLIISKTLQIAKSLMPTIFQGSDVIDLSFEAVENTSSFNSLFLPPTP